MADRDPSPHCILIGTPVDGYRVIGPFDCIEDARAYYDSDPTKGENMFIAEMDIPAGEGEER